MIHVDVRPDRKITVAEWREKERAQDAEIFALIEQHRREEEIARRLYIDARRAVPR